MAENFGNRALLDVQHLCVQVRSRAPSRWGQIGRASSADRWRSVGTSRCPQPGELREHEPHPVAALAAHRVRADPFEHRVLRLDERCRLNGSY
jgi:hypothetical protein